jgi:hypothetical protein
MGNICGKARFGRQITNFKIQMTNNIQVPINQGIKQYSNKYLFWIFV